MAATHIGDTPPPSPAVGDAWWDSASAQLYIWFNDGTSSQWVITTNQAGRLGPPGPAGPTGAPGSHKITVGDAPPPLPLAGDGWWDSTKAQLYIWYNDGTSAQWVPATNQAAKTGPVGPRGHQGPRGPTGPQGVAGNLVPPIPVPPPIRTLPTYLDPEATWEQLYDNVEVQLPGVTHDAVVMASWNTVYDFYLSTTYRREHVFWRMDPGVATLSFDPWDSHWRVFRFLAFRGLSNPKFEPPGRIRDLTWPIPTAVRDGEVELALRPIDIRTPLGDDFWAMWFDPIVAGVLGRLYMQPGKPYTDAQMARIQLGFYRAGVAQARAHVQSGFVTDGVLWRFPYFATGRPKNSGWGGPG